MEILITDIHPNGGLGVFRPDEDLAGRYYNDTGFCNRLLYWEVVQYINHLHKNKFDIVVHEEQWPEKDIIKLPNTVFKNTDDIDFSEYTPIQNELFQEIIDGDVVLEDGNYYTDFGYRQITDVTSDNEELQKYKFENRIISNVGFHDEDINNLIKEKVSDCIGIHVRRGRGVKFDLSVLETLPEPIRDRYHRKKEEDKNCWPLYIYDFVDDKTYFSYIDSILKINPNQMFYVSSDMEDIFLNHWIERYPNNIIMKKDFYELIDVSQYLHDEKYSQDKPYLRKEGILHFYNFLDLYCLSNTKMLIKLFMSSWSDFASDYKKKVTMVAKQISPRTIVNLYRTNFIN